MLGFILYTLVAPALTDNLVTYKPKSLPPSPILEEADGYYRRRGEKSQAFLALEKYRELSINYPNSGEAAWRVSMACHLIGMRYAEDHEKETLFNEGIRMGRLSLELSPPCAPCHFWTAINLALLGNTLGPIKTLSSLKEIKEHLEQVMELEPGYALGGSYRLMGIIKEKLPGILGGSNLEAKKLYLKAIEVSEPDPLNYLFLIHLLRNELNEPQEAMQLAEKALSLPDPTAEKTESLEAREEIAKILSQWIIEVRN